MTRVRTPITILCMRGLSVCCETASKDSSRGSPARTSVASWRVKRDRSAADRRRPMLKDFWRVASFCATSLTATGSNCLSRSICRIWRGVSPSRMPLCSLPPASSAVYSNAPKSILARDSQHFLERRLTAQDLGAAVVTDRGSRLAGVTLELLLAHAVMDHCAHGVIHHDELVDAGPTAITAARRVSPGAVEYRRGIIGPQVEEAALIFARLEWLLGFGAEHAHQALRHHADEARRQEEGLDAHVAQARYRAGRGVGMERGQHEVTRQARLHSDLRGLEVTDLTDHDDVRVLTQDGAQSAGEGHLNLRVHLRLPDAVDVVLDRILDGHDVLRVVVQALEGGVQSRRLTGAGRARDEQNAVRLVDELVDQPLGLGVHAQCREIEPAGLFVQNTQHHPLAVARRKRRDANVDGATGDLEAYAAVLRQAFLGDIEFGHHLD